MSLEEEEEERAANGDVKESEAAPKEVDSPAPS